MLASACHDPLPLPHGVHAASSVLLQLAWRVAGHLVEAGDALPLHRFPCAVKRARCAHAWCAASLSADLSQATAACGDCQSMMQGGCRWAAHSIKDLWTTASAGGLSRCRRGACATMSHSYAMPGRSSQKVAQRHSVKGHDQHRRALPDRHNGQTTCQHAQTHSVQVHEDNCRYSSANLSTGGMTGGYSKYVATGQGSHGDGAIIATCTCRSRDDILRKLHQGGG